MPTLTYQFDLICHLVQRDFRLHYTGSVLGVLWSVVLPLIQLLVFVFLFSRVVPLDIDDYPAFVFSACGGKTSEVLQRLPKSDEHN